MIQVTPQMVNFRWGCVTAGLHERGAQRPGGEGEGAVRCWPAVVRSGRGWDQLGEPALGVSSASASA
jgi:hypothetical protein